MAFDLVSFLDLQNAVAEELKLAPSDTTEMDRIKRDLNLVYINSVAPFKRWPWLRGNTQIKHVQYLANGTVACTPNSTTITFSTAPTTSKEGYLFAIDSYSEVYLIASHTAGQTTATLRSAFTGTLQTAATYKVWTDTVVLPTDCRETIEVYHSFFRTPMEAKGLQEFRRQVADGVFTQGRPEIYSTYDYVGDEDATRYRVMKIHPSLYTLDTTLSVDYTREIVALEDDTDEPVMPVEDRSVLLYGALERAWKRFRNTEAAEQSRRDFEQKLAQMAGRVEDSQDSAQITPNSQYLAKKRGRSISKSVSATGGAGGGNTAVSYLQNPVIEGAQITANVTVNSGVTIDGRDISADGIVLDSLGTASGIANVPSGNLAATNVQTALNELQTDIDTQAVNLAAHINDATDAHDASAISVTPSGNLSADDVQEALTELQTDVDTRAVDATVISALALKAPLASPTFTGTVTTPVTASRALVTGASSELAASATTAAELGYVNGVTSAIQTQLNTKITNPMTTGGDVIYGGASGVPTRLANGSSGQFLKSNGTTTAPSWDNPSISLTAPLITKYLSGSGTHTFTGSPLYVRVRMVGGGGGGGANGTGGGNGGAGGNTTFGTTLLVANGGSGGIANSNGGLSAAGGSASLGTGPTGLAIAGSASTGVANLLINAAGGPGAPTPFGGGGAGASSGAAPGGNPPANSGAGAGGASGNGSLGPASGGGAGGYVDAVISGSTLSGLSGSAGYAVGTTGTLGSAGTGGAAGGTGSAGVIEVTEYYQ